ncbi:tripartite motif-containing protein 45 [Plakobranchus ocellatus]|uniref:Tripartite motif-containing protein 45 n=1 Tax=Plakobranchus ocellatus TaxID=259542 RepID=A0AAV3Z4Q2_9GAST|nr:tripartite motif-containing protein 45 [Plakobranchus ocellatus]
MVASCRSPFGRLQTSSCGMAISDRSQANKNSMRNARSDEHLSVAAHPSRAKSISTLLSQHAKVIERRMQRSFSHSVEEFHVHRSHEQNADLRRSPYSESNGKSYGVQRTSSLKDESNFQGRKSLSYNSVVSFSVPETTTLCVNEREQLGTRASPDNTRTIICPKCSKEAKVSKDVHELPRNFILERLVASVNKTHPDSSTSDISAKHRADESNNNEEERYVLESSTTKEKSLSSSKENVQTVKHSRYDPVIKTACPCGNSYKDLCENCNSVPQRQKHKTHRAIKLIEFNINGNLSAAHKDTNLDKLPSHSQHREPHSPSKQDGQSENREEENKDNDSKPKASKRIVKKLKLPKLYQFGKLLSCSSNHYSGGNTIDDSPINSLESCGKHSNAKQIAKTAEINEENVTCSSKFLDNNDSKKAHENSSPTFRSNTETYNGDVIPDICTTNDPQIVPDEDRETDILSCTGSLQDDPYDEESVTTTSNSMDLNGHIVNGHYGSLAEIDGVEDGSVHTLGCRTRDTVTDRVCQDAEENREHETARSCSPRDSHYPVALWPVTCMNHPNQELSHFCIPCEECLCRGCVVTLHTRHDCRPISKQLFKDQMHDVDKLIRSAVPKVKDIEQRLSSMEHHRFKVKDRALGISKEVNDFIDLYVDALEKHRVNLLSQVDALQQTKLASLSVAEGHLQHLHRDVQETCRFVAELLRGASSDTEILSVKRLIIQRLSTLINTPLEERQELGNFLKFCSSEKGDTINNIQLFGRVIDHQASAAKSYISGDGLSIVRIGRGSTLRLTICDEAGVPCSGSNVTVKAWLRPLKEQFNSIPHVMVERLNGGDHALHFTPTSKGIHLLYVALNGEPIKGSPFKFNAKSRWRQHQGKWHCCTVCSSGGRPDVPCGCGGALGGGYLGCCHDQPGHPGGHHWSCCGKMTIESECGLVLPSASRTGSVRQFAV